MIKHNRGMIEIMRDIIDAIQNGRNLKTHIMYCSNLAYDQLNNHLRNMILYGLIQKSTNSDMQEEYHITSKGEVFKIHIDYVMGCLKEE